MCLKNNLLLLFIAFLLQPASAQKVDPYKNDFGQPKIMTGYKLVWNDEFNTDGKPDTASWVYEKGFVRNEELQWYQTENAFCKAGSLVIEGRRQNIENVNYKAGSPNWKLNRPRADFSSASIQTRGRHQWKFGRFEIRARIDTTKGAWPAIWTLGTDKEWPSNGEIDILEFYRVKEVPTLLANVAWGTNQPYTAKWHTERRNFASFTSGDTSWVKKFHTWRMDWDNDAIHLFLDDSLLNTTSLTQTLNADGTNPFLQPHFLLLNLALGGNGGEPLKSTNNFKYEVDYVRVYQQNE